MKIIYIFLIFIISAYFSLCSEPPTYNYTGYSSKFTNQSIDSKTPEIIQILDDSSALFYVNYEINHYSSVADFSVKDISILKDGKSSNLENSLSHCINSAVLISGLWITLNRVQVYTNGEGAIAVCTTNEGYMTVHNSTIATTSKNSIAIHGSDNSSVNVRDSFIITNGENSPAMSGQKGAFISCNNCSLHTANKGSPLFQIFDGMTIRNSYGLAENSQAIIADGKMEINIINTTLNCSWKENGEDIPDASGILLKNTSFNADEDETSFTNFYVKKSTFEINSETAPMILVDNAYISFSFEDSKINSKIFLKLKNASSRTDINLKNCEIEGDIIADEKANLYFILTNSKFVGAINPDGKAGYINFFIDKKSSVTLTGNSNCDDFYSADQTNSNVNKNSFTLGGLVGDEDSGSNVLISKIMLLLLAYLLI